MKYLINRMIADRLETKTLDCCKPEFDHKEEHKNVGTID